MTSAGIFCAVTIRVLARATDKPGFYQSPPGEVAPLGAASLWMRLLVELQLNHLPHTELSLLMEMVAIFLLNLQ